MPKNKKQDDNEQKMNELTLDLQRTRADFENYRKRTELEKEQVRESGKANAIMKLLPVIDNIERAVTYMPEELKENKWAQSVSGLVKNLEKSLESLNLSRIDASEGVIFNPDVHEAVQFDEETEGESEVVAEELQAGYKLGNLVMRPAMVKVKKQ